MNDTTCQQCGKTFQRRSHNNEFCSLRCQRTNRNAVVRSRTASVTRKCLRCDTEFTTTYRHKLYCDERCKESFKRYGKLAAEMGECSECGTMFRMLSFRSRTCSSTCGHERKKRLARRTLPQRRCVSCDKLFAPKKHNATTCSAVCRVKVKSAKKAQYRLSHPRPIKAGQIVRPRRARDVEPAPKPAPKPTWTVAETIRCKGCGEEIARMSAHIDCCNQTCVDLALSRWSVRTVEDEVRIGTIVLIKRVVQQIIGERYRLVDTVDPARISDIIDGVALMQADRAISVPVDQIEVAEGAVARVRRRIDREKTITYHERHS